MAAHSSERSLHGPPHSSWPQGFRSCTKRKPSTSLAWSTEYLGFSKWALHSFWSCHPFCLALGIGARPHSVLFNQKQKTRRMCDMLRPLSFPGSHRMMTSYQIPLRLRETRPGRKKTPIMVCVKGISAQRWRFTVWLAREKTNSQKM